MYYQDQEPNRHTVCSHIPTGQSNLHPPRLLFKHHKDMEKNMVTLVLGSRPRLGHIASSGYDPWRHRRARGPELTLPNTRLAAACGGLRRLGTRCPNLKTQTSRVKAEPDGFRDSYLSCFVLGPPATRQSCPKHSIFF